MLHRSFKPAKCKTALKLASSRIKLMKNKKDVQVKQLKKELAQLLESGQVQSARIRVEHVVREEKTKAAYELLEIYCELIATRLPMIESQKNCPIDLKEAIASVIFASPRCDDLPELKDVRKQLTAKYGKEFASAAVELRPNCGVGRLLVEKLSATAPDGPTKVKILSAIAEEHNIQWDPNTFSEGSSKPSEDLLNGPNTFNKASETLVDLPNVPPAPPSHSDKGSSNVQVSRRGNDRHDLPVNFREHTERSSPHSQTDVGANEAKQSGAFHPELRPSGSGAAQMEFRHPYSGEGQPFSPGSQSWNMEFKDATAAAQAAAESAERASMAARAAAELSSRGNNIWRYSTESQRDEEPQRYANSRLRNEHHTIGAVNNSFHGRNSGMHFEEVNHNQQHDFEEINENFHRDSLKSTDKSSRSASLKSTAASVDVNPLGSNLEMADQYSQKNSSELEHNDQVSFKKDSSKSEVEFVNKLQGGLDSKSVDEFEGVRVKKQSSHASSRSQSSTFSDDHDVGSNFYCQSLGGDVNENPFAVSDSGVVRKNSDKMNYPENAAPVFDDCGLDDDVFNFGMEGGHKEHDYNLDFSSPSRRSPDHVFANVSTWSNRQDVDEAQGKSISQSHFYTEHQADPIFSDSLISTRVPSQSGGNFPATFDDSDGSCSESEEELEKTKLESSTDTSSHNIYSRNSEMTQNVTPRLAEAKEGTELLKQSSLDSGTELNSGVMMGRLEKTELGRSEDTSKHDSMYSRTSDMTQDLTPGQAEAQEDTELSKQSGFDTAPELNIGLLMGGRRNKGNRHPPYLVSPTLDASSSKKTAEYTSAKVGESSSVSVKASSSPGAINQEPYSKKESAEVDRKPSTRPYFGSLEDNSDDEFTRHTSQGSQEPHYKKVGTEENKKFTSRIQVKDFVSDSDSEDDPPKRVLPSKPHLNTYFSRRTKVPPPNSQRSSYLKPTVSSDSSVTPGYGKERNSTSRTLYNTESRPESQPQPQNKSSGSLGSFQRSRLAEQAAYKPNSPSKRSSFDENFKSSAKEPPSNSVPKEEKSDSVRNSKASSMESPPKERAAHVHPKLPDYDTLAARLQSIRQNRQ